MPDPPGGIGGPMKGTVVGGSGILDISAGGSGIATPLCGAAGTTLINLSFSF